MRPGRSSTSIRAPRCPAAPIELTSGHPPANGSRGIRCLFAGRDRSLTDDALDGAVDVEAGNVPAHVDGLAGRNRQALGGPQGQAGVLEGDVVVPGRDLELTRGL